MMRSVEKIKGAGVLWEKVGRCVQVWDHYAPQRLEAQEREWGKKPSRHLGKSGSGRGHRAFGPCWQDSGLDSEWGGRPLEAVDRTVTWPDPHFSRLALAAGLTVLLGRGRTGSRKQSQEAMVGQQYILSHYSRKNDPTFPSKWHSDIERVTAYKGNMS